MAQLKEFEPIYQAQREMQVKNLPCDTQRFKRTIHMTDGNLDENLQETIYYGYQNTS